MGPVKLTALAAGWLCGYLHTVSTLGAEGCHFDSKLKHHYILKADGTL